MFTKEDVTVTYPDGTTTYINTKALDKQGISADKLLLIKHAHIYRWQLFQEMEEATNPTELQLLAKKVTELEFYLQELWGFPKNANMHKFWKMPQCECAELDNEEMYGTPNRVYSDECPIHGKGYDK